MKEVIKYIHHGELVSVIADVKGKHRENCLCFNECAYFCPGETMHCQLAEANYAFDVKNHMVTPVFECARYEPRYSHAPSDSEA